MCALEGKTVYFADAWAFAGEGPGYTFDRANHYAAKAREPSRRIDYIFVRGPDRQFRGEPLRAELAFNAAELASAEPVWPSDHFGLVADLAISRTALLKLDQARYYRPMATCKGCGEESDELQTRQGLRQDQEAV